MSQNLYLGLSFAFKNWVTFCKILKNYFCLQSKMDLFVDAIFRLKTNIFVSFAYNYNCINIIRHGMFIPVPRTGAR